MPTVLAGTPAPFRIVLITVVVTRPAALSVDFGAANAGGIATRVAAMVIAIKDLLPFMGTPFLIGNLSLNL
jgi:hypothetical protein